MQTSSEFGSSPEVHGDGGCLPVSSKHAVNHEFRLVADRHTARSARRLTRSCLGTSYQQVRDDVVLLVSELVTNAVEHGGPHGPSSAVRLNLVLVDDRVRVEVTDQNTALPIVGNGDVNSPCGRGLILVERLASRWGVVAGARGKTVWLEIAR